MCTAVGGEVEARTSEVRKARGRNLPAALQVQGLQVVQGSQLGKALVPDSVAALHVELGQAVQARQTTQLLPCNQNPHCSRQKVRPKTCFCSTSAH